MRAVIGGAIARVEDLAVLLGEPLPFHALDEGNAKHRGVFLLPFTFGAAPAGRVLSGLREHLDDLAFIGPVPVRDAEPRSEEHTSELQSRQYLVCRLLLEKKKK